MFQLLDFSLNILTFFIPLLLTIRILDSTISFKYPCYQFLLNYWVYFILIQYLQYNWFNDNLLFNYFTKAFKFWLFFGKSNNLRLINNLFFTRFIKWNKVQNFEVNYINPLMNKINPNFKEINYQIYQSGKIYLLPINFNNQQYLNKFINNFIAMFQLPPTTKTTKNFKSRIPSNNSKIMKKLRKPKRINSSDSTRSETRSRSRSRSRSASTSSSGSSSNSIHYFASNPASPSSNSIDYQLISDQLPNQPQGNSLLSIPKYKRTISPPPYEQIFSSNSSEIGILTDNSRQGSRNVSRKSSFSSLRSRPVSINGGTSTSTSNNNNNNNNHESIDSTLMPSNNDNLNDVRIGIESMNRIQELLNNNNSRNTNDLPPLPTPKMINRTNV